MSNKYYSKTIPLQQHPLSQSQNHPQYYSTSTPPSQYPNRPSQPYVTISQPSQYPNRPSQSIPAVPSILSGSYENLFLCKESKQYYQILKEAVMNQHLQSYYTSDRQIVEIANYINPQAIQSLSSYYNLRPSSAKLLVELSLFDIILYVDNSSLMNQGSRIEELQYISTLIFDCFLPFDIDGRGISLYFMNGEDSDDHVRLRNKENLINIIENTIYFGETPFSNVLNRKVISKLKRQLSTDPSSFKPKLIICLTDGSPTDGTSNVELLINDMKNFLKVNHRPAGVFFQIAQIGNDLAATSFLMDLDQRSSVGDIVDVTSSFENERSQVAKRGGDLNQTMWVLKVLLGAINHEFDLMDEKNI